MDTGRTLKRANIQHRRFLPPRWLPPFGYVNLRTHRKLLLMDRDIAWLGDAARTTGARCAGGSCVEARCVSPRQVAGEIFDADFSRAIEVVIRSEMTGTEETVAGLRGFGRRLRDATDSNRPDLPPCPAPMFVFQQQT